MAKKEAEDVVVRVQQGLLRGRCVNIDDDNDDATTGSFYSFQGIPYAKPPIADLRFKAPQPPDRWYDIRDATVEGDPCYCKDLFFGTYLGSEDCLFLNVYTPKLPSNEKERLNKAVMVWIHGGAFTHGSSKSSIYGPQFLVAEDVVLVTINYRLGVLGFLRLHDPELGVPGNAGLKDQVMALQWVQKNISAFGGDPNNVTIFGESAGAASVHYHILSPMSSGLFHRAIMQSGSALNPWAVGTGDVTPLAKQLQINTVNERHILECLQNIPVETLIQAQDKLGDSLRVWRIRHYAPVVEGNSKEAKFLPARPVDIIRRGAYNKVAMVMGYNNKEGLLAALEARGDVHVITNFENAIPHELKLHRGSQISMAIARRIQSFYYGEEGPLDADIDKYYTLIGDIFFTVGIHNVVRGHLATTTKPIYLYKMELESELNIFKKIAGITHPGVCHADELGYLFKNLATPSMAANSKEAYYVKRFTKMWTNFAKVGDPSMVGDSEMNVFWPPASTRTLNYLNIDTELTVAINPDADRMALWDDIYDINKQCKL